MPGPFHGIDLSSRALRAFQRALDVTGHNIANVNTPGYTRQEASFFATTPVEFWSNGIRSLGTGVQLGGIQRVQELFLANRLQTTIGSRAQTDVASRALGDILSVMNEPGKDGIAASVDKFFNSWSALSSNPTEAANRLSVQSAGRELSSKIRTAYNTLNTNLLDTGSQVAATVNEINQIGRTISALNDQIRQSMAGGGSPNDLLDQRDLAIQHLSELAQVTVTANQDASVSVQISQFTLVDQTSVHDLPATFDAAKGQITGWTVPIDIRGGKLAGQMQAHQSTLDAMQHLDDLANNLRTQVNLIHETGTNLNGTTTVKFFNDANPQTGAIDFDLSNEVATDYKNIATSVGGAPGDGSLALALANLRSTSVAGLGGRTFTTFQTDKVTKWGTDQRANNSATSTSDAMIQQLNEQISSVSGVNLDDEMSNMLRFQRSYQAAAKALSIFDQVTEDLIGMIRR